MIFVGKKIGVCCLLILIHCFGLRAQFDLITTNTNQSLNLISIIDSNVLIGGNYSYILKTTDLFQNSEILNPPINNTSTCRSYRIDTTTLFSDCKIGSSTLIYKSVNDGETWDLKLNMDSLSGQGFKMFDSLNGIVVCLLNKCLITNDGGNTWYSHWVPMQNTFNPETFGDSTICVSGQDSFSISDDGGLNWVTSGDFPPGLIHRNFYFLNKDTLYSVSDIPLSDQGFSYSLNHGETWTTKYFTGENKINPYDLYFLTVDEGYVVGDSSNNCRILKTLDRGETWEIIETGLTGGFFKIEFANDSIAYIAGTDGMLIRWNKNSQQAEILSIEADKLGVELYPNPAIDIQQLEIQTKGFQQIEIILVNADGKEIKKVFEGNISQEQLTLSNDVSELKAGVYFYKLKLDKLTKTIRFVKE